MSRGQGHKARRSSAEIEELDFQERRMEDFMSRTKLRFSLSLMLICLSAAVVPASAQHFKQITGTPLSQIAAGRKEVWGLYNSRVYRFNSNTEGFDQVPGALTQIVVGGGTLMQSDEVWGINNGEVYRFDFNTNTLVNVPGPKPCKFCFVFPFSQIAVGAGYADNCHPYEVWVTTSFVGSIYRYNYCTSQLENIPNGAPGNPPLIQIAVGGGGDVWELLGPYTFDGESLGPSACEYFPGLFQGSSTPPIQGYWDRCFSTYGTTNAAPAPGVSWQQLAVGINDVWAVDSAGEIWSWAPQDFVGQPWAPLLLFPPGDPSGSATFATKIASGGDGAWIIYGFSATESQGLIARYNFQNFGFINVPLPPDTPAVAQIAVGSGAGVWVLDTSDEVFVFVRP
jgi:hypothetical protein